MITGSTSTQTGGLSTGGLTTGGLGGKTGIVFAAKPGVVMKPRITVTRGSGSGSSQPSSVSIGASSEGGAASGPDQGGGGGGIDISAVTAVLEVGKIPVASITAPPEFSEGLLGSQTSDPYQIKVGGAVVFTGYIGGPSGHSTGESVSHSNSLIHLSRDLDQSRMWSPGIHSMSMDDWACYYNSSFSNGSDTELTDAAGSNFNLSNDIVSETIKIVKILLETVTRQRNNSAYGNIEAIKEDATNIIPLLSRLYAKVPCLIDRGVVDAGSLIPMAAARYMARHMTESRNSNRSVWDTLQLMLSVLGLTTVCDAAGNVAVMPIMAGCKPPEGNFIDDDWITSYDYNSIYSRNISNVIVISYAASEFGSGPGSSAGPDKANKQITRWAMYPEERNTSSPGSGALVMPVPMWLTPEIGKVGGGNSDAGVPQSVLVKYAQSIFYEYRNAGRSVKLVTPFCPSAMPGTTIGFHPSSAVKAFSGKKTDQGPKSGYLWKVVHAADTDSKTYLTEWHIKSIYLASESENLLESPPFFSDSSKPFSL